MSSFCSSWPRSARRAAGHPESFCTRRRNSSPRCSKLVNWSNEAQAGVRSTTSPADAVDAAAATASVQRAPTRRTGRRAPSSAAASSRAASPIEVRAVPGSNASASAVVGLRLAAAAEDDVLPASGERRQRTEGSGRVRRLRVVHEEDAVDRRDLLDPMLDAGERRRARGAIAVVGRRRSRGRRRSPRPRSRGCAAPRIRGSAGSRSSTANSTRRASPGTAPNPRGTTATSSGALALEGPELRGGVRLERPVPVEVVRLEVRQHRDPRPERLDVLELEATTARRRSTRRRLDARRRATSAAGRCCRRPRPPAPPLEHRAEQRRRRRLPVRPRDADQSGSGAGARRARSPR